MVIKFGRAICGDLPSATIREWIVTNGIGGYASGTIAGQLTRRYHGLLIAALDPPLGRTLLLTQLNELVTYAQKSYELNTDRWAGGTIAPQGYRHIESFELVDHIPTWQFACADALVVKQIWMEPGANTTYIQYKFSRGTQPLQLQLQALVNYRDYHGSTQNRDWCMAIEPIASGLQITAYQDATPLYLISDRAQANPAHQWHYNFELAQEQTRGLSDREDHLHAGTFKVTLNPGESLTFIATTEQQPNLDGESALKLRQTQAQELLTQWQMHRSGKPSPDWIDQLVLAADQFIVDRPRPNAPKGKTIIAGYPWFSDWGRDTMISLPGLTIATGRPEIARSILQTFAQYVDRGMLPNRFPDAGEVPEYNTVDATLWYFEAIRSYYEATNDEELIRELFPMLADIIAWHCQGTRYGIHLDATDGLLYAGEPGVQLTWMDAKVDDWVVTPRIGKPIEVNALWYNALRIMAKFAQILGRSHQEYSSLADRAMANFSRFWNPTTGYCYDLLDGPEGNDSALRPNQIFAVSLTGDGAPLLTAAQRRTIVETCGRLLLTSHGLRSLDPRHPSYQGHYGGNPLQRDGAYHQGTVWGWLLGPFVMAHLQVYGDRAKARQFLAPMADHLLAYGLGTASEIFDGDAPMTARGCIAQAWTVAEVLRAWVATE
ncbi:MAG: glycogen debranching protein [Alkalinema sp. RU_4_3]|nr:glycogen debranching protein [Alkalinema sp. RU_4_3]